MERPNNESRGQQHRVRQALDAVKAVQYNNPDAVV
jgi:hypothetical protein